MARELLSDINEMGMPVGSELLDTIRRVILMKQACPG
jgi:3-deoxy-D-arabino-heptulosonate 7-phosphate (DAHP) synthase